MVMAIEVISPSETPHSINANTERYLRAGTKQVWDFYPEEQVMEVWRQADNGELRMQSFTRDLVLDCRGYSAGL